MCWLRAHGLSSRNALCIDLTFNATVLAAGPVKHINGGEGKIISKLTFINGAVKWAFIDKDRAVLTNVVKIFALDPQEFVSSFQLAANLF